jgi:nucleoid-associated protein YgaU
MPELEDWTDLSKWQGDVPDASLRAMKADGITGICVGSWHGIDANPYARSVLSRARNNVGLDTATYYVFNNRGGRETVERAIAACGQREWDACLFHAPDVEIRGITEQILRDGINATKAAGGLPIIYTGNWFWNWWRSALGHAPDFRDEPSWIAVYNGLADLNVVPAWGLGPMKIHQYTGSTQRYGTTVDFNVADKAWIDLARQPTPPVTEPEPEPPAEGDPLMGKILDLATAFGRELEAEIARAKALPVPIKGDKGDTGATGPAGGGGGTTQRTYTVKSGDNLSGIAEKYPGVSWRQIYEANKALIGSDPDTIQPGQVLVIPG